MNIRLTKGKEFQEIETHLTKLYGLVASGKEMKSNSGETIKIIKKDDGSYKLQLKHKDGMIESDSDFSYKD